jgi:hypothetical protein
MHVDRFFGGSRLKLEAGHGVPTDFAFDSNYLAVGDELGTDLE